MEQQEKDAWIRLALTPYVGPETFFNLVQYFGSAQAALSAGLEQVKPHLHHQAALKYWRGREAEEAMIAAKVWEEQHPDGRLLLSSDVDYPVMLTEGMTSPPLLFVRGKYSALKRRSIAIVGSRHATPQAKRIARDFAQSLSDKGIVVVSGMADGVDTAAHEGALNGESDTIAIWGTGIDRVYPAHNRSLAERIIRQGCVVSEFPIGTRPLAGNFPRRNRLVAGVSVATLVVEAAVESGALITAKLATEIGRDVFAIPGSIDNPLSKGCHWLIKQGAKLTECLDDILEECPLLLQDDLSVSNSVASNESVHGIDQSILVDKTRVSIRDSQSSVANFRDSVVLNAMGFDAIHPDTVAQILGISAADVYAEIIELELAGCVAALPGGRYQRI